MADIRNKGLPSARLPAARTSECRAQGRAARRFQRSADRPMRKSDLRGTDSCVRRALCSRRCSAGAWSQQWCRRNRRGRRRRCREAKVAWEMSRYSLAEGRGELVIGLSTGLNLIVASPAAALRHGKFFWGNHPPLTRWAQSAFARCAGWSTWLVNRGPKRKPSLAASQKKESGLCLISTF